MITLLATENQKAEGEKEIRTAKKNLKKKKYLSSFLNSKSKNEITEQFGWVVVASFGSAKIGHSTCARRLHVLIIITHES
jgi:hypothetical protein